MLDSICTNELGDPDELLTPALSDWRDVKDMKLLNLVYDLTPADLITLVITELGHLPVCAPPATLSFYRARARSRARTLRFHRKNPLFPPSSPPFPPTNPPFPQSNPPFPPKTPAVSPAPRASTPFPLPPWPPRQHPGASHCYMPALNRPDRPVRYAASCQLQFQTCG